MLNEADPPAQQREDALARESQQKSRTVTKYRFEPRSQPYRLIEHLGAYDTSLSVAINLEGAVPTVAHAEGSAQQVQETSNDSWARLTHTEGLPTAGQWLGAPNGPEVQAGLREH